MRTIYALLPVEIAESLVDGNEVFPEDVPLPTVAKTVPGSCIVFLKVVGLEYRKMIEEQLNIKLMTVELSVAPGRLMEINEEEGVAYLASGIRSEDFVTIFAT